MAAIIGIDPHQASHTAVAIDEGERTLDELRVRSSLAQAQRRLDWAAPFSERTWADSASSSPVRRSQPGRWCST
jgi:hypothetical protein